LVAYTKGEGAARASVRSVDVVSVSHCGGGHDRWEELLWALFARSAWSQPANMLAGTTGEVTALASFRSVGVGSARHSVAGHNRRVHCSGMFSHDRCWLSQPLWWRTRHVRAQIWPPFALSAWSQPATVVAVTKIEGTALASVRSVDVGSTNDCGRVHDM
jgi:hypothetical protein